MGRVGVALLLAALALLATACGERSEPTGPDLALYPVTVQTGGDRPLVVAKPAARVVALSETAADSVRALGVTVRGVPVESTGQINFRRLKQLRPDLIVAPPEIDDVDLSRAASLTGATVYTTPADSIEETERTFTQLGLITGHPVEARDIVRRIEQRRGQVRTRLVQTRPVRVFVDRGFFTTVSDHSLLGDLIAEAHGRNIAGPRPEPGPFDPEQLAHINPDVYLTTSDAGVTLQALRKDARTRNLTAVKKGRVVVVNAELLEPGPRVGDALLQIARLLHPDAFR
jgi:iron complex transport system substrate-binding protein